MKQFAFSQGLSPFSSFSNKNVSLDDRMLSVCRHHQLSLVLCMNQDLNVYSTRVCVFIYKMISLCSITLAVLHDLAQCLNVLLLLITLGI